MQLYALDPHGNSILATDASRHTDYQCLECGSPVRLRKGDVRHPHFYHTSEERECRQNGKSLRHLGVQLYLLALFSKEECSLEVRFQEINRIADVVWYPKKLIFEVQCSPITALEVSERNRDYAKLGYQVIWLFHDARFNKKRVTAAEAFVQKDPHYFTNIDRHGNGVIYDQFEIIQHGIRKFRMSPLAVDLTHPNQIGFSGDYLDLCSKNGQNSYLERAEKEFKKRKSKARPFFRPYQLLFRYFIERASI